MALTCVRNFATQLQSGCLSQSYFEKAWTANTEIAWTCRSRDGGHRRSRRSPSSSPSRHRSSRRRSRSASVEYGGYVPRKRQEIPRARPGEPFGTRRKTAIHLEISFHFVKQPPPRSAFIVPRYSRIPGLRSSSHVIAGYQYPELCNEGL